MCFSFAQLHNWKQLAWVKRREYGNNSKASLFSSYNVYWTGVVMRHCFRAPSHLTCFVQTKSGAFASVNFGWKRKRRLEKFDFSAFLRQLWRTCWWFECKAEPTTGLLDVNSKRNNFLNPSADWKLKMVSSAVCMNNIINLVTMPTWVWHLQNELNQRCVVLGTTP